ncbi:hypothetical protein ACFQV2_35260 [Actinokineospora soli]|uniref:Proteins of 100 residues with WXG n=1 Tax=Actinokineospora soli TaxID=1048753 RepID=A0ABW2TYR3_9PSEU
MTADAITAALVEPGGSDTGDTSTALLDQEITRRCEQLATRGAGGVYARWRTHPAAGRTWEEPAWGTPEDEKLLADLRGIEFWALDSAAARLAALTDAADALRDAVDVVGNGLYDAWDESVATAAAGRFGRYAAGVRSWQDGVAQLAVGLDAARDAVSGVLRGWADDARAVDVKVDDPQLRQAQIDRIDDALGRGTLWGRTFVPDELRSPGLCDLNLRGAPPWPSHDVMGWLDDFCGRYDALVGRFRAGLRAAHDAVTGAWRELAELAGGVDRDPFAAALAGPSTAPPVTGGDKVVIRDGDRTMTLVGPDEQGRYGLTVDGKTHVVDPSDGPVTIRDGDTTITAEQLGPGRLQLTVDDGDGPPERYTVESTDAPPAKPVEPADPRDGARSTPSDAGGGAGGPSGGGAGGPGGGPGGPGGGAPVAAAPTPLGDGPMTGAQEMDDSRKPAGARPPPRPVRAAAAAVAAVAACR